MNEIEEYKKGTSVAVSSRKASNLTFSDSLKFENQHHYSKDSSEKAQNIFENEIFYTSDDLSFDFSKIDHAPMKKRDQKALRKIDSPQFYEQESEQLQ